MLRVSCFVMAAGAVIRSVRTLGLAEMIGKVRVYLGKGLCLGYIPLLQLKIIEGGVYI